MNAMQLLLSAHSTVMRDQVIAFVGKDTRRFASLVDLFLNGSAMISQRAGWPLSHCVEHHPHLIKPHLRKIVRNLRKRGLHDAVKRNTMRLLQFIDIPTSLQGEVSVRCFDYLPDPKEPIAVRVFAMSVLARIAQQQPELQTELRLVLEDQMPFASPGFTSRARKTLRQLDKMKLSERE